MMSQHWTFSALLASTLVLSACNSNAPIPGEVIEATPVAVTAGAEPVAEIATRPFPADSLHDLLVAEFAVRRSRFDLALGNYLKQAHSTRDRGVAARATRLAQFLNADNATLDAAQLWAELAPENLEARYSAATALAKNARPLEALSHMEAVLHGGGKTNFAAIVANALQQPPAQLADIETAIEQLLLQYPLQTQLLTSKALILQQRREPEQALALIQQVLTLDETDMHAVVVEARLLSQLERFDQSLQRLQQAVANQPKNRRLRLEYARLLMPRDIPGAQGQFELLLEQTPRDPDLLLSLALIDKELENYTQAQAYFERLLALDLRTQEAQLNLGQLAELRQDWQQAIVHYRVIDPGRSYFAAANRIVNLYLQQGLVQTARDHLTQARDEHPQLATHLYLLEADLLLRSKLYQAGHQLTSEALLVNPAQPNLLYIRSVFSEKRGDFALMEQDLLVIIEQDPNNATALNALGYVLANHSQRLDHAYDLIKRAIAIKPEEPAIMDSLGWVEFRRGNWVSAEAILQRAYKAFPDPEIAAHLGEVLWQLGQRDKATAILEQALQRDPDSLILKDTLQRLQASIVLEAAQEHSAAQY